MTRYNTPEQRDAVLTILQRTFPAIRWKVKTTWIETTIHGLFLCLDWNQNGNLHIRFDDGHLTGKDPEQTIAELRRRMEKRLAALQAALAQETYCEEEQE